MTSQVKPHSTKLSKSSPTSSCGLQAATGCAAGRSDGWWVANRHSQGTDTFFNGKEHRNLQRWRHGAGDKKTEQRGALGPQALDLLPLSNYSMSGPHPCHHLPLHPVCSSLSDCSLSAPLTLSISQF